MSNWSVTYSSNSSSNISGGIFGGSSNSTYVNICANCWPIPCQCTDLISNLKLFDALTEEELSLSQSAFQVKEDGDKLLIVLDKLKLLDEHKSHILRLPPDVGIISHPIILRAQYTRKNENKDTFLVLHGVVKQKNKQYFLSGSFLEVTDNFMVIKLLASLNQYRKQKGGDIRE
jgi:hypothetical protein